MKDVPITHGYRKFFTNKLIEYDERAEEVIVRRARPAVL